MSDDDSAALALPQAPDIPSSVTLDTNLPFALVAQSLQSIGEIADEIATRVKKLSEGMVGSPLVIVAENSVLAGLADLRTVTAQLEGALGAAETHHESLGGIEAAAAFLSNATALLSYLKIDRTITNFDPAVENSALQARLSGALINVGCSNVLLPMHFPAFGNFDRLLARALNRLAELQEKAKNIEDTVSTAHASWLESILTVIMTGEGSDSRLAALHAASGLESAMSTHAEAILVTALLLKSGGHSVVDKHLFTLLGFGGQPRYSGGAAVSVTVSRLKPNVALLHADTLHAMTPEAPFKERRFTLMRKSF